MSFKQKTTPPPLVLIAAGGTGGHMFPAQSLAEEMLSRGWRVALMSDDRGLRYSGGFPDTVARIQIGSATFARGGLLARLLVLPKILGGALSARWFIFKNKPAVIVGFGGYPSIPALLAGGWARVPRVIHEQNALLGRVNRRFAPKVNLLTCALPLAQDYENTTGVFIGNPLRKSIQARQGAGYIAPGNWPLRMLIIGGSQGSAALGEPVALALATLPEALRTRLTIIHQAREEDAPACHAIYTNAGIRAEVAGFFDNIGDHLVKSQLVISRSGASSISEIAAIGRPSVLIPLPTAMDDHQSANARCLADIGAGIILPQDELDAPTLKKIVTGILNAPTKSAKMAQAALMLARPDAAVALADLVMQTAQDKNKNNIKNTENNIKGLVTDAVAYDAINENNKIIPKIEHKIKEPTP